MLMYLFFTETSGARTCWFHKKKKQEQVKNAETKYEDSMPQWRGISVVLRKIRHALDTGPGLIEKRIGFVHVHFLCTLMTSIPAPYRKGSTKCLTAPGV